MISIKPDTSNAPDLITKEEYMSLSVDGQKMYKEFRIYYKKPIYERIKTAEIIYVPRYSEKTNLLYSVWGKKNYSGNLYLQLHEVIIHHVDKNNVALYMGLCITIDDGSTHSMFFWPQYKTAIWRKYLTITPAVYANKVYKHLPATTFCEILIKGKMSVRELKLRISRMFYKNNIICKYIHMFFRQSSLTSLQKYRKSINSKRMGPNLSLIELDDADRYRLQKHNKRIYENLYKTLSKVIRFEFLRDNVAFHMIEKN